MQQLIVVLILSYAWCGASGTAPTDNPVETMYGTEFPWTNTMVNWTCVVDVSQYGGDFTKAQAQVSKQCGKMGGVVYYPAGKYTLKDNLEIQSGVVIRGEPDTNPANKNGKPGDLSPKTMFECEVGKHMGIFSADSDAANIGVVNIYLKGCAVMFWPALSGGGTPPFDNFKSYWYYATKVEGAGSNKLVLGNVVQDVTLSNPDPPRPETAEQWEAFHTLKRHYLPDLDLNISYPAGSVNWPWRFSTAIAVYTMNNSLIANNLMPKADVSSKTSVAGFNNIPYPYDNRYGIDAGQILYGGVVGKTSGGPCLATAQNSPFFFATGQVVRDNYVYQNGRVGVSWSGGGDGQNAGTGTVVANNHVEVASGTTCYTVTGDKPATGHDTNENRGYNEQGFECNVANNTGAINRQKTPDGYETVDGEGILHQCAGGSNGLRNIWSNNDLTLGSSGPVWFYKLLKTDDNILTSNHGISIVGGVFNSGDENKGNQCHDNKPSCTGLK